MPLGLKFIQDKRHIQNPSSQTVTSILFVGTFIPLHGISVIIEAMKLLRDYEDLKFKFIGDGSEAYKLEAAIKIIKVFLTWSGLERGSLQASWLKQ